MDDDVRTLARLVKQQARRVEREVHTLRQMAATLEQAASDTSEERTPEHVGNGKKHTSHEAAAAV